MTSAHPNAARANADGEKKWRRRRRFLRGGQALMIAGGLVLVAHWLTHLEAFARGQPPGWLDLAAGYPMGGLLIVVGAIVASQK